jgi:ribosome-binding protein aMBF1 (putative translation factor)
MPAIPINWKDINCDRCDARDVSQSTEPQHVIYQGASMEVCQRCYKEIQEEIAREKARQETARRRRASRQAREVS